MSCLLAVMASAAFIAFLVAARMPFTVVVSAHMALSMVMTTIMTFTVMMAVVIAFGVGIILQCPFGQHLRGRVCRACHAAVEFDSRLSQSILRTHADAAADQRVRLRRFQKPGKSAVTAAVGGDNLLSYYSAILHIVELELLGVAKMLEDLSVFVSNCDSHVSLSFLNDIFRSLIVEPIVSAPDQELLSLYQRIRDLAPCAFVDGCHRGAGNAHFFRALLLGQALPIQQADRLEFVQRHHDRVLVRNLLR